MVPEADAVREPSRNHGKSSPSGDDVGTGNCYLRSVPMRKRRHLRLSVIRKRRRTWKRLFDELDDNEDDVLIYVGGPTEGREVELPSSDK